MPQWRKLHTKTLDSLDIAEMPDDFCRLTWLMLPLIVDREGRALDDANWLRSKLFPLRRDVTHEMVECVMGWLYERGMITRYEVKGRTYFAIVNFALYQGNTEREAASVIPEPVKQSRKSKSGVSHDPVLSKSVTDVDVDVDAEEKREETPPGAKTAPDEMDDLKELSAVFEQASGIKAESLPKKQRGPMWWHPLGLMLKTGNGSAADEVRAAVSQLRQRGLTLSSPNSILKTFNSIHGQHSSAPTPIDVAAEFERLNAHLLSKGKTP